jgi:hypothetical protein
MSFADKPKTKARRSAAKRSEVRREAIGPSVKPTHFGAAKKLS